jgi:hypothetical protein
MTSHCSACRRCPVGAGAPTLLARAFPEAAVKPCHQSHSGPRRKTWSAVSSADVLCLPRRHRLAEDRSPNAIRGGRSSARHAGLRSQPAGSMGDRDASPSFHNAMHSMPQDPQREREPVLSRMVCRLRSARYNSSQPSLPPFACQSDPNARCPTAPTACSVALHTTTPPGQSM